MKMLLLLVTVIGLQAQAKKSTVNATYTASGDMESACFMAKAKTESLAQEACRPVAISGGKLGHFAVIGTSQKKVSKDEYICQITSEYACYGDPNDLRIIDSCAHKATAADAENCALKSATDRAPYNCLNIFTNKLEVYDIKIESLSSRNYSTEPASPSWLGSAVIVFSCYR